MPNLRAAASALLAALLPSAFQPRAAAKSSAGMAEEDSRFDLVVFGASGFTGEYVVEEMGRVAVRDKALRWAVAGRSESRLRASLARAAAATGIPEVERAEVIVADSGRPASLRAMAARAKLVLNCVGPYRFHGEAVVEACLAAGAHHVDISGEPQFLEAMQLKYGARAEQRGVYVVGACGFDSIPAEMGVRYTEEQFNGDLNSVQCFINLRHGPEGLHANFGTWQSAIYGFAHRGELAGIRRKLFPARLPTPEHRLSMRRTISYVREVGAWCVPFPGSDRSVVQRTQRFRHAEGAGRPLQFHTYLQLPSLGAAFLLLLVGAVFALLASCRCGRALLERFPGFFSGGVFRRGGPTREQVAGCSFTMTFLGEGWPQRQEPQRSKPKKSVMTCVSGPEPGYVATPICMIQAALTILQEKDKLPGSGGVFTPGAAFAKTRLIQRLQENRIVFMLIRA